MDIARLRRERLRAHRLAAPAPSVVAAARHLGATQAQEFWGGRWALAVRATGEPTLSEVDAAFERGALVRSWTQRGTLHVVAAGDLDWILTVTADRQHRQAAGTHRALEITGDVLARAERAVRAALSGGNRLTRAEFAEVIAGVGIDSVDSRGNHVLSALCVRGVMVLGPVVPRADAPSRDQYLVAADEWITDAAAPTDPLAELLVRYLRGHGPASLADFRWWTGLTLGLAREARDAAGDRVVEIEEGMFAENAPSPDAPDLAPAVLALPPFEEYYISYADRTVPCTPEVARTIGPRINGVVRPLLLAGGEIVGAWSHSVAVGRHHLDPVADLFVVAADVDEASVAAALARFARFIRAYGAAG